MDYLFDELNYIESIDDNLLTNYDNKYRELVDKVIFDLKLSNIIKTFDEATNIYGHVLDELFAIRFIGENHETELSFFWNEINKRISFNSI